MNRILKIIVISFFWMIPLNKVSSQVLERFIYDGVEYSLNDVFEASQPPKGIFYRKGLVDCREELTELFNIPMSVFKLIKYTEGGKNGLIVQSKSKKGRFSYDVGLFQINEINFKSLLKQGINPFMLVFDDCASMTAAAIIIEPFYKKAKKEAWEMHYKKINLNLIQDHFLYILAGYNSQNHEFRKKYSLRLKEHFTINTMFSFKLY